LSAGTADGFAFGLLARRFRSRGINAELVAAGKQGRQNKQDQTVADFMFVAGDECGTDCTAELRRTLSASAAPIFSP
jgi:hypothetical protein